MERGIRSSAARRSLALIACGLTLLMAGCGSGTSSGSTPSAAASATPSVTASATPSATTTPSNSVLCADAAALRAALDKLKSVKDPASAVAEIKADLQDVQAALKTFADDARNEFRNQTDALKSALAGLTTAVSNLAAHPGTSAASDVVTAFGEVNTAAQNLLAAVSTECPSA